MHDDEPELAEYEPGDGKPLRSPYLVLMMRVVVIVGIAGLILPGIIQTISMTATNAQESCRRWVKYANPDSPGHVARFELFGAGGPGWECYTKGQFGGDEHVATLGLIPGPPSLPSRSTTNS
jgi:hypothetical protein